jgi:hypothetical protein
MRPTSFTKIRWLKMISVKDCKRNECICGNNLRRKILKIPISPVDERIINNEITELQKKYNDCYK